MTTDERLDKLAERHEALTETVEILGREVTAMQGLVKEIAEGTARLLHVAEIHEQYL